MATNIYRPCPNRTTCPAVTRLVGQGVVEDPDSPLYNFSSEAPDPINYLGVFHYDTFPPPDTPYQWGQIHRGTTGGSWSGTSQQQANDNARNDVNNEGNNNRQSPPGSPYTAGPTGEPTDLVGNEEITCGVPCADGTGTYTLPADTITAKTQEEANILAQSICNERAGESPFCIDTADLPGACVGDTYSEQVTASGGAPFTGQIPSYSYLYGVSDGSLPTGLEIDPYTGLITGNPSTGGAYTFTVQALDSTFNVASKEYTIIITEITSGSTLESGVEELSGYSQTLAGTVPAGCTGVWSVTGGALPSGLALNPSTGEIYGEPAAGSKGDYSFEITLTVTCT